MKVISVLYISLAVGYAVFDEAFKEQKKKELLVQLDECSKKEMSTKEDLEAILIEKPLTSKGSKCLMACLNELHGVQDKNGKLNVDGALGCLESFKVDMDIYNKLQQIYTKCLATVVDAGERCETAGKFFECEVIQYKEMGLSFNFLEI